MTECRTFEDNFCMSFTDAGNFENFLAERKDCSSWETVPSRSITFYPAEKDFRMEDVFSTGVERKRADVLADTIENTNLAVSFNAKNYPVRNYIFKIILKRQVIFSCIIEKSSLQALYVYFIHRKGY